MSFADDRALKAFQGLLTLPKVSERALLVGRGVDATAEVPPALVVPALVDNRDPLEDQNTRRNALVVSIPAKGTPSVISVLASRRDLAGPVPGQLGGPGPFGGGRRNAEYILTSVRENLQEKYHIYQTFQGYILYSLGRAPSVYTFSGYLLNTAAHQGSLTFLQFYENYLKASAAVAAGVPAAVSYLHTTVSGYVLSLRIGHTGASPGASEFSFDLLLS